MEPTPGFGRSAHRIGASPQPPAVFVGTENPGTINVNALYLEWINEFSALTVGRCSVSLRSRHDLQRRNRRVRSITLTNKDLVAYKIYKWATLRAHARNRKSARGISRTQESDINDYMVVAEYVNNDSELSLGFMFDQRVAPQGGGVAGQGDDMPLAFFTGENQISPNFNTANPAIYDPGGAGFSAYNMNFYVKKSTENFSFAAELGFDNGYTGVRNKVFDNSTGVNAYKPVQRKVLRVSGVATETTYKTGDRDLQIICRYGEPGDNPDSEQLRGLRISAQLQHRDDYVRLSSGRARIRSFEKQLVWIQGARQFHRSQCERSQWSRHRGDYQRNLRCTFGHVIQERCITISSGLVAVTGHANATVSLDKPTATDGSMVQIGIEGDLGFRYHPSKNFQWVTTLGGFFPGSAYANVNTFNGINPSGYPTSAAYGATSKAAINF